MAFNYNHRRYKVVDGKVKKQFDTPAPDGWFVTKAEAWAAWNAAQAAAHDSAKLAAKKVSVGYGKRRYCVIDGKLVKSWDSNPLWFTTKAEAWAAIAAEVAEEQAAEPAKPTPDPAASETPPVNGRDQDTTETPEVEEPETETPEPEIAEAPPEPAPEPEPTSPGPTTPQRVLRMSELISRTGHSRTAIQRQIEAGTFPKPDLDLGNGADGWYEATIAGLSSDRPDTPKPEAL